MLLLLLHKRPMRTFPARSVLWRSSGRTYLLQLLYPFLQTSRGWVCGVAVGPLPVPSRLLLRSPGAVTKQEEEKNKKWPRYQTWSEDTSILKKPDGNGFSFVRPLK